MSFVGLIDELSSDTPLAEEAEAVLCTACAELDRRLRSGDPCRAEEIFQTWPELAKHTESALEVIYTEFLAREESGETLSVAEYLARFPQWRKRLEQLLKLHTVFETRDNADATDAKPGKKTIGNYVILDKLGAGGMGTVFRARHQHMDRVVALKVLSEAQITDAGSEARFQREIRAVAKLSHPNIVSAFDAGYVDGVQFLVMELINGCNLSRYVEQNGQLTVADAVCFIRQAAEGLQHTHEQGIIHRDIKPSNLMLVDADTQLVNEPPRSVHKAQPWIVKILDLGLAGFRASSAGKLDGVPAITMTATGTVLGTVDFMAPEQTLDTKYADHRSDIYSLGGTFYFLLTGQTAYTGETFTQRLVAHREQPIPLLRDMRPDVPLELEVVFQKMFAKRPEDRYQSMTEVVEAFRSLESRQIFDNLTDATEGRPRPDVREVDTEELLSDRAVNPDTSRSQRNRRNRWLTVTGLLVTVVLAVWRFHGIKDLADHAVLPPKVVSLSQPDLNEQATAPSSTPIKTPTPIDNAVSGPRPAQPLQVAVSILPGILQRPAALAGITRWQVESVLPRDKVNTVSWSPDGQLIALGCDDRQIRIYDVRSFRMTQLLVGHTEGIVSVDWHPTEPWLASAAKDGTVRIWNISTGDEWRQIWSIHAQFVRWSPDGQHLALACTDKLIHVLPLDMSHPPIALQGHTAAPFEVCWNHAGTHLASAGGADKSICIWKPDGELQLRLPHDDDVLSVAWHPADRWIAAGLRSGRVQLWTPDGTAGPVLDGPIGMIVSVAWNPTGSHLAVSGCNSGTSNIETWTADGTLATTFQTGLRHVEEVDWSPDGTRFVAGVWESSASVWTEDGRLLATVGELGRQILSLAWKLDGTDLAAATSYHPACVWREDGTTPRVLDTDKGSAIRSMSWTEDGRLFAACLNPNRSLLVWTPDQLLEHAFSPFPDQNLPSQIGMDVDRSSQRVAVGGKGVIRIFDRRGQLQNEWNGHSGQVWYVAWHPSNGTLATSDSDGMVRIWDANGSSRELLTARQKIAPALAWHPDGDRLAVGEGTRLWSFKADGSDPQVSNTAYGAIQSLSWSRQGSLAIAHQYGTVTLWNNRGESRSLFDAPMTSHAMLVAWHPDNRRIAVTRGSGLLEVWDTERANVTWQTLSLPGNDWVSMDSGGQLLSGHQPDLENRLVYIVETAADGRRLLTPAQFRALQSPH